MFLEFYQLREQPFGVTPDPKFLYLGSTHREALASLLYGIKCGRGFLSLIAPPGMGKTTTLFCLLEQLGNLAKTAFIFESQSTPTELLRHLLSDLGIKNVSEDRVRMHQQLKELLIAEAEWRRQVVVIVDEAQNLSEESLEAVRLLSNFERPGAKLLQVILAGQPPLADKLALPHLVQLRQRIAIMAWLEPFRPTEVEAYIQHRLQLSGYRGPSLFDPEAFRLIGELSSGIPRLINSLCFNALSIGCALKKSTVGAEIVGEAAADLDLDQQCSPGFDPSKFQKMDIASRPVSKRDLVAPFVIENLAPFRAPSTFVWHPERIGSTRWAISRSIRQHSSSAIRWMGGKKFDSEVGPTAPDLQGDTTVETIPALSRSGVAPNASPGPPFTAAHRSEHGVQEKENWSPSPGRSDGQMKEEIELHNQKATGPRPAACAATRGK